MCMDLGALTAKRDGIIQKQAQNTTAKETNTANINTNAEAITANTSAQQTLDANIKDANSQISGLEQNKSGVGGEIADLQGQLNNPEIDDTQREQINSEISSLEDSMEEIEKDMAELAKMAKELEADSTKNQEELKTLDTEKGGLEQEKTGLDEKTVAFETALKEVDEQIAIFNEIHKNADGTGDSITPETIDKAFSDLEGTVLADGATLVKERKRGDSIVREYSDGTKIWHTPGESLAYEKSLNDGFIAVADMRTSESKTTEKINGSTRVENHEYDNLFFGVTDHKIDKEGYLSDTGFSREIMYQKNEYNTINGSEVLSSFDETGHKSSINSYDGYSRIYAENDFVLGNERKNRP